MADTETKITNPKKNNDSPKKIRRVLRVVAYNVLFTFIGLGFIALTGEVYLRLKRPMMPFTTRIYPLHFVPKVGLMLKPNDEARWTNHRDFWTISRTNSLGFLDREPISPERAAASCHIAMISDSFVQASEVPIADKFHIHLEELAARHLPHLDITTSAFGQSDTGQINQLPYYDKFARHLSPKLIVLVFVRNDFRDNSPVLSALWRGIHPDRQPYVTATRAENSTMKLRPPHPDWQQFRLPNPNYWRIVKGLRQSYFVRELQNNIPTLFPSYRYLQLIDWMKFLSRHPDCESVFNGLQPEDLEDIKHQFNKKTLLPAFEKELAFTAFALDQFKERTERDGGSLVILTSYTMGTRGHGYFDHLSALAEARGISVIDQYDYIRRQGADPERDARWANDYHWNIQGHQWAAEALLEYLKENPEICTKKNALIPRMAECGRF